MKALLVHSSRYGNTLEVAEAIATELRQRCAVECVAASAVQPEQLAAADLLVVGGPTQQRGIDPLLAAALDRAAGLSLPDKPTLLFDTRYRQPRLVSGSAASELERRLARLGCKLILPPASFYVLTVKGPLADGELARARAWARRALAELAGREEPVTGNSGAARLGVGPARL